MTDFKVGDRVRATLGENVLVGEVTALWPSGTVEQSFLGVNIDTGGDVVYIRLDPWHIEKVSPLLPTKHGAVVGHKNDPDWIPYVLLDGEWYCPGDSAPTPESDVRFFIEKEGFEVIFEGVDA